MTFVSIESPFDFFCDSHHASSPLAPTLIISESTSPDFSPIGLAFVPLQIVSCAFHTLVDLWNLELWGMGDGLWELHRGAHLLPHCSVDPPCLEVTFPSLPFPYEEYYNHGLGV